ncbi:putrescine carbamoyltransferase [Vibrio ishigakensis]|uniref:Putrescine carbamoyltransferase n=1 Tax=Vibrio ishigakensis TaxID=1481914 RepID=A0A0B8PCQ7_9VIBR|nr:putrescine carbamoyltransferase [Vibrio ishigakensis]
MKLPSSSATELKKANLEHMVSMKDFSVEEMDNMMELMSYLKQARKDNAIPQLFKGKSVGMIFEAALPVLVYLSKSQPLY